MFHLGCPGVSISCGQDPHISFSSSLLFSSPFLPSPFLPSPPPLLPLPPSPLLPPLAIVGHCDLSSSDAESVLQQHCQSNRMRGIRHMLNYHPEKMIYSEAPHDNFLTDPQWLKGLALLEKYNLSFEMHVLPRQMHR